MAAVAEPTARTQFDWSGEENVAEVLRYAAGLGARDTDCAGGCDAKHVLPLSRREASALVTLYRHRWPSVLLPEVSSEQAAAAERTVAGLASRI